MSKDNENNEELKKEEIKPELDVPAPKINVDEEMPTQENLSIQEDFPSEKEVLVENQEQITPSQNPIIEMPPINVDEIKEPIPSATFPPEFTSTEDVTQQPSASTEKASNSKLPIYIILAVVLVAGLLFFLLRGSSNVKSNPKGTLESALTKSIDNLQATPETLPDLEYSHLDPRKMALEVGLANTPGTYLPIPEYLQNLRLKMEFRSHLEEKKLYASLGFESPIYTVKTSEFFLTTDSLSMRIPNLYNDTDFITVNLKNFVKDWNASEFGEYEKIPKNLDVSKIVNTLYDFQINAIKSNNGKKTEGSPFSIAGESFVKALNVAFVESKEDYHYLTGELSPEEFSKIMHTLADDLEDYGFHDVQDLSEMIPKELLDIFDADVEDFIELYMESTKESSEIVRSATLEEPLILHFKISKKNELLQEIYIPELVLRFEDSYGYEEIIEVNIRVVGNTQNKYLMDDFTVTIIPLNEESDFDYDSFGYSDYGDEDFTGWEDQRDPEKEEDKKIEKDLEKETKDSATDPFYNEEVDKDPRKVSIHRKRVEEDHLLGATWTLSGQIDSYMGYEPLTIVLEHSWNPKETKENNFSGRFSVVSDSPLDSVSLHMSGLLLSPDKETLTFTNGKFSVKEGLTEVIGFDVQFENIPVKANTISPDIKTTVDFFKVDWEKQIESLVTDFYMSVLMGS